MQKSQVVLGFLVPAYQEPAKPIHPAMRAFNDPATCLLASVLAQLLGLFATRPDVRGEANFTQEVAHFVVVVTLVQTHPLGVLGSRRRTLDHQALQGDPCQFPVMAIRAVDGHAEGHPKPLCQHAPLDSPFAAIGRVAAGFFPRLAALWSSPRPYSTTPSRSRRVHR